MTEHILTFFTGMNPLWAVFWLSMLPVTEIRASIPVGIEVFKLPVWETVGVAILGDIIPSFFILKLAPYIHTWITKQKILGPIFSKKMAKASETFSGKYSVYGAFALVLFVGIPLPMTGAWTGSFLAFLFNIPFKKSFPAIVGGVLVAAFLITMITLFAGETLRMFI